MNAMKEGEEGSQKYVQKGGRWVAVDYKCSQKADIWHTHCRTDAEWLLCHCHVQSTQFFTTFVHSLYIFSISFVLPWQCFCICFTSILPSLNHQSLLLTAVQLCNYYTATMEHFCKLFCLYTALCIMHGIFHVNMYHLFVDMVGIQLSWINLIITNILQ